MRTKNCLAAVVLLLAGVTHASTNGEQDFHFFGKSGDTIWITEDIGGEYQLSMLHQLMVSGDDVVHGLSNCGQYCNWKGLGELIRTLETENVIPMSRLEDGSFGHDDLNWTVSVPVEDPNFVEAFNRHIEAGGSNARSWARANPSNTMQMPQFKDARAQLLYSYGRGLYVNYRIDWACWLPQSRLLVLFTYQPLKAVGLDTMHGFMLLRIREENPKS